MAEVKLRLNLDAGEVELVVDGQVALSSGQDVFANWVDAYNAKHTPPKTEPVLADAPVQEKELVPEAPVAEPVLETPVVETEPKESVAQPEGE